MKVHKNISLMIYSLLFVVLICKVNGAEHWQWGTELHPQISKTQAAMSKTAYESSTLTKFPLLEIEPEPSSAASPSQVQFLKLEVARHKPHPVTILRSNTTVQFDLVSHVPILAETANDPKNAVIFAGPASGGAPIHGEKQTEIIDPIDITLPKYKAHGVIISLFRGTQIDSSGKAEGRLIVGTGYLVSPQCVATAAHNIVLNNDFRKHPATEDLNPYAERVEFWPLLNGFTPDMFEEGKLKDGGIRANCVKLHPKWDPQGRDCTNYDIAVLNLNDRAGIDYGCCAPQLITPFTKDTDNIDCIDTYVSGYAAGKEDISFIITECKGKLIEPYNTKNRTYYSLTPGTQKGQSGGGIRFMREGKQVIVGAHTQLEFDHRGSLIGAGGTAFSQSIYDLIRIWVTGFENIESA